MTAPKPKFMPKPRDWTDVQVAAFLGMSGSYFAANREALYAAGMPRPDPLLANKTDSKALKLWHDKRSGLVDPPSASNENPRRDIARERVHGAGHA